MKKATKVEYNPYTNRIEFQISESVNGPWVSLSETSDLLQYTGKDVLFSNCVSDIVETINRYQNITSEGLEILFSGPISDYELLQKVVRRAYNRGAGKGPLTCRHVRMYKSADDAIEVIKNGYSRIASEFNDYLPGGRRYERGGKQIGDAISRFEETISDATPVCFIGNYSVGKSALINALIGDEILPSKENPSTAKNAEVVRSDRYAITVEYKEGGDCRQVRIDISEGRLSSEDDSALPTRVCEELRNRILPDGKTETQIVHEVLDLLNDSCHFAEDDLIGGIGWNVIVELPFEDSLLSGVENRIVFFDTPGSDNDDLDHDGHDRALMELMGEQTNALPILVTSRDQLVRKDTAEIRATLDSYADNFASPCCIVVLTKCDLLNRNKLEEGVPAGIKNWHGKSIILFTTPIGALGSKKSAPSQWIDGSYRADFESWSERQNSPKRVSLPEYNIYPCEERDVLGEGDSSQRLFATGIPSLEYEIAYYVKNFGRYKKCVRGKRDLVEALESVQELLNEQKARIAEARKDAGVKRASERRRLVRELDAIQLPGVDGIADSLMPAFASDLNDYCDSLSEVMADIYDETSTAGPFEMDSILDRRVRKHCQKNLIDTCYLREGGAKDLIRNVLVAQAVEFANALQSFVTTNDFHFSEFGSKTLHAYLDRELELPRFSDVESVLASIAELFEKTALLKHELFKLANYPGRARAAWINDKKNSFEGKLRDGTTIFGGHTRGLFAKTLLDEPIASYYAQLEEWAEKYRAYIREQLDSDNAILSGMEAKISALDETISDLESRIDEMRDVYEMLTSVLDAEDVEAVDDEQQA